jgi:hypothetical protein
MLPFLSILIGIVAMVFIAKTTSEPTKLYRFTSTNYNVDHNVIIEIYGKAYDSTLAKANDILNLYDQLYAATAPNKIQWAVIEEIDEESKEVKQIMYTLVKDKVNEQV